MADKVLLIFEDTKNIKKLKNSLSEIELNVFVCGINSSEITQNMASIKPDFLVFYYQKAQHEIIDIIRLIQKFSPLPIIIFVDQSDDALVAKTITNGASAFIVDGIDTHRISSIIEAAKARFVKCQNMISKLNEAELKLDERRDIDRAKGILMSTKDVSEDEAYKLLRNMAMNKNKRIGEIAKTLITASELLE